MLGLRRSLSWEEGCVALLVAAGGAAFAMAQLRTSAWAAALVVPCFGVRLLRVPPGAARLLPRLLAGLLAGALLFGLVWALYPVVPDALGRWLPRVLGAALLALAVLFLAGSPPWAVGRTALPAAIGLMAVAALDPDALLGTPIGLGALATFLYLAGPRGWRGLVRLGAAAGASLALMALLARGLPWAQPRVEALAASVLDLGLADSSGLSLDSTARLGDVQRLALSRRIVMRVWTPRPQKLRARVFTRFDGTRWSAAGSTAARQLVPAPSPPAWRAWLDPLPGRSLVLPGSPVPRSAIPTQVVQLYSTDRVLLAPLGPRLVRAAAAQVRMDATGLLAPSAGSHVAIYGLLSDPGAAGAEPDPEALGVPPDTDPRLRELAARLAEGASAEVRVQRTLAHLARECRYSLEPGRFRGPQPVAEFLFEKKRGYCEYFASAAALLLRLEGVPTRYVTGFNVPGAEWSDGHYVVRDSDAHAWIEAWLPGRGFVELDPTPADQYAALHSPGRGTLVAWEWLKARWSELDARLRAGDPAAAARWLWGRVGAPLLLAALVFCAWRLLRRSRRGRRAVAGGEDGLPPELARLLGRVDRHWRRLGAPRPASRGPLEHLESLPQGAPGAEAAGQVVSALYAARFAGAVLPPARLEALDRALDAGGVR